MPAPILPVTPSPLEFRLKLKGRTVSSQAESGKILSRSKGTSYYEMTLVYPPMRRDQFGPIAAFLAANAKPNIFYITVDPMTGTAGETVGNHINFDNDTKLHLVTETGPTVVTPAMRNAGGLVVTAPVYLCCSLKGDVQEIKMGKDGLVRFEVDVVERV